MHSYPNLTKESSEINCSLLTEPSHLQEHETHSFSKSNYYRPSYPKSDQNSNDLHPSPLLTNKGARKSCRLFSQ